MKKFLSMIMAVLISCSLVACGGEDAKQPLPPVTLDSSTEQAFLDSLNKMEATLKPKEKEIFRNCVSFVIAGNELEEPKDLNQLTRIYVQKKAWGDTKILEGLHGATYQELIDKGMYLEKERDIAILARQAGFALIAWDTDPTRKGLPHSIDELEQYGFKMKEGFNLTFELPKGKAAFFLITVSSSDGKLKATYDNATAMGDMKIETLK